MLYFYFDMRYNGFTLIDWSFIMKYLPVDVYTHSRGVDCSNGGVSATAADRLVVPAVNGYLTEEDVENLEYIVLDLCEINVGGDVSQYFKPAYLSDNRVMSGGAFIFSTDSRFRKIYGDKPIRLHDRVEG